MRHRKRSFNSDDIIATIICTTESHWLARCRPSALPPLHAFVCQSVCLSICLSVYDYSRTTGYEAAYERYQQLQCYKGKKNNVAIWLKRLCLRDMAWKQPKMPICIMSTGLPRPGLACSAHRGRMKLLRGYVSKSSAAINPLMIMQLACER